MSLRSPARSSPSEVCPENSTILDTAHALGAAVGILESQTTLPGGFVESDRDWSFERMKRKGVFGHLRVSEKEMGVSEGDEAFVDLHFTIADAPYIGRPLLGESMVKLLQGSSDAVHSDDYITTFSHRGRAYVRQGKWKLVNLDRPFDESVMELFDLEVDPGETRNLAKEYPEQYQHMLNLWRTERTKLGIILPQDL